jgi:gas vesicle protein
MRGYNGSTATMGAFLAGAFLGAGVALVVAPKTGVQMRKRLRNYAEDAADQVTEAWDSAIERGMEYIETGQEALSKAGKMMDKALNRR